MTSGGAQQTHPQGHERGAVSRLIPGRGRGHVHGFVEPAIGGAHLFFHRKHAAANLQMGDQVTFDRSLYRKSDGRLTTQAVRVAKVHIVISHTSLEDGQAAREGAARDHFSAATGSDATHNAQRRPTRQSTGMASASVGGDAASRRGAILSGRGSRSRSRSRGRSRHSRGRHDRSSSSGSSSSGSSS